MWRVLKERLPSNSDTPWKIRGSGDRFYLHGDHCKPTEKRTELLLNEREKTVNRNHSRFCRHD